MVDEYKKSYSLRMARNAEKQEQLLRFLRSEYYVSADNVAALFNVVALPPVYRFLSKMEADGFLVSAVFGDGRGQKLWGLTPHGVAFSFAEDETITDITPFQPSKISTANIRHHLDVQRLRIFATRQKMHDWLPASSMTVKGVKTPDAVAKTPTGKLVAIEVERTVKTPKRYREIAGNYLTNRQAQGWDAVWYIMPDSATKNRVQRIFENIDSVVINGATRNLSELGENPLGFIKFLTYEMIIK
ncbi:MobC family replication-relaxation protein [Salmonella enterica subsp. enterica serovar Bareilly]|uniref:MobC family replication-relaxation protein n=1 Tax=Aeromonas veronii TaxID=654 RepID=UPI003D1D7D25